MGEDTQFSQGWNTIYIPSIHAEHVVFYVSLGINLTNVLFIVYAIWFRSYPPIKAKHVWITAGIGVGSTIFNLSFNVISGMVGYHGWLSHCRIWGGWLMMTFGLGLFLSFLNMRLVIHYRVFITRHTCNYKQFTTRNFVRCWWPIFALWFPSLLSSVLICALPDMHSLKSVLDNGVRTCDFNYRYLYWVFVYFGVQVIISWVLYFRMRHIAKAFNEFRLALATLLIFTAILAINVILACTGAEVQSWGRIVVAWCNTVLFNSYFWMLLGPPVVGHMFWREETQRKFLDKMYEDGLIAREAQLGNIHQDLYGVEQGSDAYIKASAESSRIVPTDGGYAESVLSADTYTENGEYHRRSQRQLI
ncbi:hypothetical protein GGI12_001738 [Dipsacomyces acuminosporus]|nr:hypothetical protein GGI12_001738 [Dipsacomyces acuminosporus]